MNPSRSTVSGFTLIEIIVTLTVAGLLAVMLIQFMGTSLSRSVQPILTMQTGMALQGILENMNADYKQLLLTDPTPLETFRARVGNGDYGACTLLANDYIFFDSSRSEAACDPANTDCRILKVTISDGNQALTTLFTR